MQNTNRYWHILWILIAITIALLSLVFDQYPQFPSMCFILGITLGIFINTMPPVPPVRRYHWHQIIDEIRAKKIPIGKALLFMQAKIVFPTLFSIYLILLIIQKVKVSPAEWQAFATTSIDTLQLLWVTLISAILTNFSGLDEKTYEITHHSPVKNTLTIFLICLLSYGSMWAIFAEIAVIGRVAYFVSLIVGMLVAFISMMILTETEDEPSPNI